MTTLLSGEIRDRDEHGCIMAMLGCKSCTESQFRGAASGVVKCQNLHVENLNKLDLNKLLRNGVIMIAIKNPLYFGHERDEKEKLPNVINLENSDENKPLYSHCHSVGDFGISIAAKIHDGAVELFFDGFRQEVKLNFDLSGYDDRLIRRLNSSYEAILGPIRNSVMCKSIRKNELWMSKKLTFVVFIKTIERI